MSGTMIVTLPMPSSISDAAIQPLRTNLFIRPSLSLQEVHSDGAFSFLFQLSGDVGLCIDVIVRNCRIIGVHLDIRACTA